MDVVSGVWETPSTNAATVLPPASDLVTVLGRDKATLLADADAVALVAYLKARYSDSGGTTYLMALDDWMHGGFLRPAAVGQTLEAANTGWLGVVGNGGGIIPGATGILENLASIVKNVTDIFGFATNPENWLRLAAIGIGAILILMGARKLM